MPKTEVDELKDIFKEHGDQNSLPIRDVPGNTELKQVFCLGEIIGPFIRGKIRRALHKTRLK